MTAAAPTPSHGAAVSTETIVERWKTRLANLTELQFPTDYPRPLPLQVIEAERTLALPDRTCLALLQLSLSLTQENVVEGNEDECSVATSPSAVTPFTVVLAAFAVLLHRYTSEEDIVLGSSSSSCNPLVLRLRLCGSDSFESVVRMVKKVSVQVF
jgi:L-aminoadipate-semialdehyde dehydrogenase